VLTVYFVRGFDKVWEGKGVWELCFDSRLC